ncbi:CatB-related O-acetyltransferase [Hyphococcus flavus]|uniref:CatB-related O-acetyltransferase n=1 Tax=Hyphococcus flavus TaxID=1866326 RepID=A0AAF0CGW6_9PROT|nr:CatB-related O-acetyltransferase [Hyphococcus flavus]WDI31197.1 CatB-related O-acetyltransferase [Hyphococcus flavus]
MSVRTNGPDPDNPHPMTGFSQVGFLKPLVDHPMVEIGEYTYYDDPVAGPECFLERCVRYHFEHLGDRLIIGRYCAIAVGVQFIMNGANHTLTGLSTYPFAVFGQGWEDPGYDWANNSRGDTVIGNDVWIGTEAMILPGVTIGDGAIIGARAVVGSNVPAYGIAVGNPARTIKRRFDDATVLELGRIAWWNWPVEKVTANLSAIRGGELEALQAVDNTA